MGPIARVLWECLPELLHVGAVLVIVALMVAIMGSALFGDRAASFSSLAGKPCYILTGFIQQCRAFCDTIRPTGQMLLMLKSELEVTQPI